MYISHKTLILGVGVVEKMSSIWWYIGKIGDWSSKTMERKTTRIQRLPKSEALKSQLYPDSSN